MSTLQTSTQYRREKAKKKKAALIDALQKAGYTVDVRPPRPPTAAERKLIRQHRAIERQIAREEKGT